MTFLSKLSNDCKVFDAFKTWPEIYGPFGETCQQILRDSPSALTAGERELIGAFVSGLNACDYCHETHNSAVVAYGIDKGLTTALKADIDTAAVNDKLKPLLKYVRKLTVDQNRMVQADADEVYTAGWSEDDLHCAIAITALFNFMNRFVHGLGINEDPEYSMSSGARLKALGYTGSSRLSKDERDHFIAENTAE